MTDPQLTALRKELQLSLKAATNPTELYEIIANEPFKHPLEMALLFLGFICFYLVDEDKQTIYIAGVSHNEYYEQSIAGYDFEPADYHPSLSDPKNIICEAIRTKTETYTEDWGALSRPEAKDGAARLNQASAGIGYTKIYPLTGKTQGALMFNYFQYADGMGSQQDIFMKYYAELVASVVDALPVAS